MNLKPILIILIFIIISTYGIWGHLIFPEDQKVSESIPKTQVEEPTPVFPSKNAIALIPDIITETDKSTFKSLRYMGQKNREVYDRRAESFITVKAFLYHAVFEDGRITEVRVNPEFEDKESARKEAEKYAKILGQLPSILRRDIQTMDIHKGKESFGGGNFNVLVYTDSADDWEKQDLLEEVFIHEAGHAAMDMFYKETDDWIESQKADGRFISSYAEENPEREDLAESLMFYLAVRYRADRISPELRDSILAAIPNRIKFFDSLNLDMYPY